MKLWSAIILLQLILIYSNSPGQDWNEMGIGAPIPDMAYNDQFGYSMSMVGNLAVIGAPGNDDVNLNAGKAFVYEKKNDAWQMVSELSIPNGNRSMQFGISTLIHQDLILIGATRVLTGSATYSGGVFLFKKINGSWQNINLLQAEDHNESSRFGLSLAADGDLVAVGAIDATGITSGGGAVYLFAHIFDSPIQTAKVFLQSETSYEFGESVALNSQNLFVGDVYNQTSNGLYNGAVFVFDRTTLEQKAKLKSSFTNDYKFGESLSVSSDVLAVGATQGFNPNGSYGAVLLFEKPVGDWSDANEAVRFTPSEDFDTYGEYGQCLYLVNNNLIVGSNSGIAVDFYTRPAAGWSGPATFYQLKKPGFTYLERYGSSFATNGTDLFVGAYNLNSPGESSGVTFVYEKTNPSWSSLAEKVELKGTSLNASDDAFGNDVDMDGDYAVVGAPYDDVYGESSGAAYVFKFDGTTWNRIAKLTPSDGSEGIYFGESVAIDGNRIVISATSADPFLDEITSIFCSGKVYVFEKSGNEWSDSHEVTSINRPDNLHEGQFGYHVDADNNEIVIAQFRPGDSDAVAQLRVYIKDDATWSLKANLTPSIPSPRAFGTSLAFNDSLIVVGAPYWDAFTGAVFVFKRPNLGWADANENAILMPSDPQTFSQFGSSVAINKNSILVGSLQGMNGLGGVAYVFENAGEWKNSTEKAKLSPTTPTPQAAYGRAVALEGNYAAVSSSNINSKTGSVLFFKKLDGEWKNTSEYSSASGTFSEGDEFGYSMSLENDHLIVGAPSSNSISGKASGSVRFYLKQPTVVEVNSSNPDGTYKIDDLVNVKVILSQPVDVVGTPSLELSLNGVTRSIPFKNLTSGKEINFEYKVMKDDYSDDLDYKDVNSLKIGISTLKSKFNSSPAFTDLPVPGSDFSLAGLKNIVIDGEVIVIGISDPTEFENMVYPNPFENSFRIEANEPVSITLTSLDGSRVLSQDLGVNETLTPDIKQGMYLLDIKTEHGTIKRVKVIKL